MRHLFVPLLLLILVAAPVRAQESSSIREAMAELEAAKATLANMERVVANATALVARSTERANRLDAIGKQIDAMEDASRKDADTATKLIEVSETIAAEAYVRIEAAQLILVSDPGTGPPDPPPPGGGQPDDALGRYIGTLPFASELPAFPEYTIPGEQDCDYILEPGGTRPGVAYRSWLEGGHTTEEMFTLGIRGDVGSVRAGHGWGSLGSDTMGTLAKTDPLHVRIVGLTENSECHLAIGDQWAQVETIQVFNLGCRGEGGNFIVSVVTDVPLGDVIFDGCWWLNRKSWVPGSYPPHTTGLHLADHRSLVFRNHKYRGFYGREHCLYIKSSTAGPSWVVENDMKGGNRTWFQRRPGAEDGNERPTGPFIVLLNEGDSYGWEYPWPDGGAAITVWTAPDDTAYIAGNKIRDARYGGIMLGGQPPHQGNWLSDDGFPINRAWIYDNEVDNDRSQRATIGVAAVGQTHIGQNTFSPQGKIVFNGETQMGYHGIRNGEVFIREDEVPDVGLYQQYNASVDRNVPLTESELTSLTLPLPPGDNE